MKELLVALILLGVGAFSVSSAASFTNPIRGDLADPFLTYTNGLYYLLGTDGTGAIKVFAAPSLSALGAARAATVYQAGGFYESPELYWQGAPWNRWYIYYTRYPNSVIVIESDSANPAGTYHYKATLATNTYDATLLHWRGTLYLLGSTYNHLVIQPLANPYTVSGSQAAIAGLDQPWETTVIEAPEAVVNPRGTLFLLYSSGTYNRDNYGEGVLRFKGGDPMVEANWTKLPGPIFRGTGAEGNHATATCSSFHPPTGTQTWFVYGGYRKADFSDARSTRVQPMEWNPDGSPWLGTPLPLSQVITNFPVTSAAGN